MIDGIRPYPAMKDSGVEWLGEVPEHWGVRRVKSLSLVRRGASPRPIADPRYFDSSGEYAWVRIADVSASGRYLARTVQRLSVLGQSLSVRLEPGALFLSIAGSVGKPIITRIKCCIHDGFVYFPRFRGNAEFVYYVFSCGTPFGRLGKLGTQLNLNTDTVGGIRLGWPPLLEQAAIVRFLDHANRQIRRCIRAKQSLIALLEEQQRAIIHRSVTRGLDPDVRLKPSGVQWLGDVPVHWDVLTLRRVISRAVDGPHHSPSYLDSGIPFLSARNIKADRWSLDDAKFISEKDYAEFSRRVVPEVGDVLYTKGGTTGVARAVDLSFRFQVWVHVAVLKVKRHKAVPEYLALVLNSPRCYEQAQLFTRGATNQDLGLGRMKGIVFALPPLSEQKALLRALDAQTHDLRRAVHAARREIELLREYRTRLVADVVTGKLDVREAAARLQDDAAEPEPLDEIETEDDEAGGDDTDDVAEEAEA